MDWFDLFAFQGTLKSLLQHHISKASILWHWAFFVIQLSHPYMTRGGVNWNYPLLLCHNVICSNNHEWKEHKLWPEKKYSVNLLSLNFICLYNHTIKHKIKWKIWEKINILVQKGEEKSIIYSIAWYLPNSFEMWFSGYSVIIIFYLNDSPLTNKQSVIKLKCLQRVQFRQLWNFNADKCFFPALFFSFNSVLTLVLTEELSP